MIMLNEEKGFVLFTALLIMIILTLVGMGAILNSSVEINISRNERLGKEAFYAADAGGAVVSRIINYYITQQPASISAISDIDIRTLAQDDNFVNEINGTHQDDNACSSPDFQTTSAERPVNIDIDQVAKVQPQGQNIVFLVEDGVAPPVTIFYRATCRGYATDNRFVDVELFYRYIPSY